MNKLEVDAFISDCLNYPNIGRYEDVVTKKFFDGNDTKRGTLEEVINNCDNNGVCFDK